MYNDKYLPLTIVDFGLSLTVVELVVVDAEASLHIPNSD